MTLTAFAQLATLAIPLLTWQALKLWPVLFTRRKYDLLFLVPLFALGCIGAFAWLRPDRDYLLAACLILLITLAAIHIGYSRRVRRELARADQLRTISELAAGVSHEVRNPLTVTRGFISLMRQPDLSEDKKDTFISLALEELDRAQQIITDYLSFAKPRQDKLEPLQLAEQIDYVRKVMQPLANLKQVELRVHRLDARIWGDRTELRQAILNLLKNAIEATEPNGIVEAHTINRGSSVSITVKDNGVGIASEDVARIGTPFFTTKEGGTGLGMMVVHSIIHSMGGSLTIESEIGRGTCVTVTLPRIRNEEAVHGEPQA